jgi:hypothetical protein
MHAVLEYLAVGVLLIAIIAAAGYMLEAPSRTLETVREEQLLTVAERLMDKILLTPGYPPDWGSNIYITDANLTDFGLALQGGAPYIVDPDKVMRLANLSTLPNPLLVNASRLAELLGVKGQYGFKLVMKPMITAEVETLGWINGMASKFRVRVLNWQGEGLPNANVTGVYVVALVKGGAGQPEVDDLRNFNRSCLTDALGYCELDYTSDVSSVKYGSGQEPATFLILHTKWEGFVAVTGYSPVPGGAPVDGYIIGSYVFMEKDVDVSEQPVIKGQISGAVIVKDEIVQVVPQYSLLLDPTEVDWCREQPNDPMWCHDVAGRVLPSRQGAYLVGKVVYLERLSSHVIVFAKWRGSWTAVVISRIPSIDISYGPRNVKPVNAATLTRVTQLYNYPYVVQLTVWRWVEGWP